MTSRFLTGLLLAAVALGAQGAFADGEVGLFEGLASGQIRAQFRGDGDDSVLGRLWGTPGGPDRVTLEPGTQFWAQFGGGQQGMGLLGSHTIDLGDDRFAQVILPTACTNFGLKEPRRIDVMVAEPCPDPRIARLASLAGEPGVHHAALQIAVWAVANDPAPEPVRQYAERMAGKLKRAEGQDAPSADALFAEAAELLGRVELEPGAYLLFRRRQPGLVPLPLR